MELDFASFLKEYISELGIYAGQHSSANDIFGKFDENIVLHILFPACSCKGYHGTGA